MPAALLANERLAAEIDSRADSGWKMHLTIYRRETRRASAGDCDPWIV